MLVLLIGGSFVHLYLSLSETDSVRKNWSGHGKVNAKDVFDAVGDCLKHAKQRQDRKIAAAAASRGRMPILTDHVASF